jgi:HlyD family secretion protein
LRRRYQIDDMRRQIRVTEARLAFDGQVLADRDGTVLDLQVIQGQTVATGQRLGTLGRAAGPTGERAPLLRAVAYFAPADARRLPAGLPVEVVPLWDQRGRFGGIVGKVTQVLALPATEEDISTTIGNPQLARDLLKRGPVMRTEIALERDPTSRDGYRWTLSGGSGVFPCAGGPDNRRPCLCGVALTDHRRDSGPAFPHRRLPQPAHRSDMGQAFPAPGWLPAMSEHHHG